MANGLNYVLLAIIIAAVLTFAFACVTSNDDLMKPIGVIILVVFFLIGTFLIL